MVSVRANLFSSFDFKKPHLPCCAKIVLNIDPRGFVLEGCSLSESDLLFFSPRLELSPKINVFIKL